MSRGTLLSIAALQLLTILLGLLRSKGLSLMLGPGGFGIVSTIDQVVMTLVQLGALGLPFTALRYMARGHSQGLDEFRRTGASFVRILAVAAIVTTLLGSALLAWRPAVLGADLVPYRGFVGIALLGIPAVMLNILFVNTLAAAQRPAAATGLNLLVATALAIAAIVGGLVGGIRGLYVAVAATGTVAFVASLLYLRATLGLRLSGHAKGLVHELRTRPDIISSSASYYMAMAVYSISLLAIRSIVFSDLGETQAGLLQASLSIGLTVGAILSPMSNLYLSPMLNRAMPARDKARAANVFAEEMLLFLLLGALPIVLFPTLLLRLLYTDAFAPAAATIGLFVVWQCIYQIANVYQQLLIGLDDLFYMSLAASIGYGGAALLSLALVPAFGLGGAAGALAAGMTLYGVAAAVRLRIRFRVDVPLRVVSRAVYVGAVVIAPSVLFRGRHEILPVQVALRLAYAAASLSVLWLLLTPEERAQLRALPASLLAQVRGRRVTAAVPVAE